MFIYIFSVCVLSLPSRAPEPPFWLTQITSYDSRPIFHRQSTDIPPTINWNRIDWVLTSILAKTNTQSTYRSICRLTCGQVLADMSTKMSANTSADISTDSQPIWQLTVSWYGSWHVNQVAANRVDQYSTMGCSNYTRPGIFYCPL